MTAATNRFAQAAKITTAPGPVEPQKTRYTVNLSGPLRQASRDDIARLRGSTGKNVVLSDVIRELLWVLHEDESLYEEIQRRIARA